VSGSFLNGVVGTRSVGREISSWVAIMISFCAQGARMRSVNPLFYPVAGALFLLDLTINDDAPWEHAYLLDSEQIAL
jgi:hypothetical protein